MQEYLEVEVIMIIKPGVGIDQIKFGMSQNEVIKLLGEPTRILVDEDDKDKSPVFQYNQLRLRLTFYREDDMRLGYIRTTNRHAKLQNQNLIGIPIEDALKAFGHPKSSWEEELYFTFNSYFNETIWTVLHEEYGVVSNIELGYLFDEKGENPIWPE